MASSREREEKKLKESKDSVPFFTPTPPSPPLPSTSAAATAKATVTGGSGGATTSGTTAAAGLSSLVGGGGDCFASSISGFTIPKKKARVVNPPSPLVQQQEQRQRAPPSKHSSSSQASRAQPPSSKQYSTSSNRDRTPPRDSNDRERRDHSHRDRDRHEQRPRRRAVSPSPQRRRRRDRSTSTSRSSSSRHQHHRSSSRRRRHQRERSRGGGGGRGYGGGGGSRSRSRHGSESSSNNSSEHRAAANMSGSSGQHSRDRRDQQHQQKRSSPLPPPQRSPPRLFQDLMVNEPTFQQEVLPPLLDNLLLPSLRSSLRLSNPRRVHNPALAEAFTCRQAALRRRGWPAEVGYAFLLLDASSNCDGGGENPSTRGNDGGYGEEERLCAEGLAVGHSILGHLGPADAGVSLSLHPDTCSPAPLYDRVKMRVLVVKVLKGKTKVVNAAVAEGEGRPDPAYSSYMFATRNELFSSEASPQTRFKYSQIYLYEYSERGQLVQLPGGVLPWAVVSVSFGSSSGLPTHYLLSVNEHDAFVWGGALRMGDSVVENMELVSPIKGAVKPAGFGSTLEIQSLVPWSDCLRYAALAELTPFSATSATTDDCRFATSSTAKSASSTSTSAAPPRLRSIASDGTSTSGALLVVDRPRVEFSIIERDFSKRAATQVRISYFTLVLPLQPNSASQLLFRRWHSAMHREQLAGMSLLPNGDVLIAVPNGELASLLSLPAYEFPALHCLFVNFSEGKELEWCAGGGILKSGGGGGGGNILDERPNLSHPSSAERLDGDLSSLFANLAQFHTENGTNFNLAGVAPTTSGSVLPAGLSPACYPPSLMPHHPAGMGPPSLLAGMMGPHQPHPMMIPHGPMAYYAMSGGGGAGTGGLAMAPPPPPPPPPPSVPSSTSSSAATAAGDAEGKEKSEQKEAALKQQQEQHSAKIKSMVQTALASARNVGSSVGDNTGAGEGTTTTTAKQPTIKVEAKAEESRSEAKVKEQQQTTRAAGTPIATITSNQTMPTMPSSSSSSSSIPSAAAMKDPRLRAKLAQQSNAAGQQPNSGVAGKGGPNKLAALPSMPTAIKPLPPRSSLFKEQLAEKISNPAAAEAAPGSTSPVPMDIDEEEEEDDENNERDRGGDGGRKATIGNGNGKPGMKYGEGDSGGNNSGKQKSSVDVIRQVEEVPKEISSQKKSASPPSPSPSPEERMPQTRPENGGGATRDVGAGGASGGKSSATATTTTTTSAATTSTEKGSEQARRDLNSLFELFTGTAKRPVETTTTIPTAATTSVPPTTTTVPPPPSSPEKKLRVEPRPGDPIKREMMKAGSSSISRGQRRALFGCDMAGGGGLLIDEGGMGVEEGVSGRDTHSRGGISAGHSEQQEEEEEEEEEEKKGEGEGYGDSEEDIGDEEEEDDDYPLPRLIPLEPTLEAAREANNNNLLPSSGGTSANVDMRHGGGGGSSNTGPQVPSGCSFRFGGGVPPPPTTTTTTAAIDQGAGNFPKFFPHHHPSGGVGQLGMKHHQHQQNQLFPMASTVAAGVGGGVEGRGDHHPTAHPPTRAPPPPTPLTFSVPPPTMLPKLGQPQPLPSPSSRTSSGLLPAQMPSVGFTRVPPPPSTAVPPPPPFRPSQPPPPAPSSSPVVGHHSTMACHYNTAPLVNQSKPTQLPQQQKLLNPAAVQRPPMLPNMSVPPPQPMMMTTTTTTFPTPPPQGPHRMDVPPPSLLGANMGVPPPPPPPPMPTPLRNLGMGVGVPTQVNNPPLALFSARPPSQPQQPPMGSPLSTNPTAMLGKNPCWGQHQQLHSASQQNNKSGSGGTTAPAMSHAYGLSEVESGAAATLKRAMGLGGRGGGGGEEGGGGADLWPSSSSSPTDDFDAEDNEEEEEEDEE